MKQFLLIVFCFTIVGCSKIETKTNIIPNEFSFSNNKSVYYYKRIGGVHQSYSIKLIKNDINHIVHTHFLDDKIIDSTEVLNNLKINYFYIKNPFNNLDSTLYKTVVDGYKIIESKNGLTKVLNFSFFSNNQKIEAKQEERFISDTIITHNGLPLKCLITETVSVFEMKKNRKSLVKRNYWTKEYSLIMFKFKSNNQTTVWYQTHIE